MLMTVRKEKKRYSSPTTIRQRYLMLIKCRTHFYGLCLCTEHIPLPALAVTAKNSRLQVKREDMFPYKAMTVF